MKRFQKKLFVLSIMIGLILLNLMDTLLADTIVKKDGQRISGKVINVTREKIEYKTEKYPLLIISRIEVREIIYDDGTIVTIEKDLSKIRISSGNQRIVLEPEERVHNGFYFRFLYGAGRMRTTWENDDYQNLEINGSFNNWVIDLGGAIDWNLILYFQLGSFGTFNPGLKQRGVDFGYDKLESSITTMGMGLCYYLPWNSYISLAYNTTRHELYFGDEALNSASSEGDGFFVSLGHEFWVSSNIGLGLSLFYHFSKIKENVGATRNRIYGLAISATYN